MAITAFLVIAGCTGDAGDIKGTDPQISLRVVSGAPASDTVDAVLPQMLVVELRDQGGLPRARVPIRFIAEASSPRGAVGLSRDATGRFVDTVLDTTDFRGRSSVRVRLGSEPGTSRVSVRVAEAWSIHTVVDYTVLPGAPVSIELSPSDTALYAGRSYHLRSVVRDRHGNVRDEPAQYRSTTPAVVGVAGGAVETLGVGRGIIEAAAGDVSVLGFVSVPPVGVISATRVAGSTLEPFRVRILNINLDGTGETILHSTQWWADAGVAWNPTGTELAFATGNHTPSLYRLDASGTAPLFESDVALQSAAFPRYSRDGTWIYFNGQSDHQNSEIWRVRSDGTYAERVGPDAHDHEIDAYPDVSPDGSRVAYSTNRVDPTMPVIRTLTLLGGIVHEIDVPGVTPRWTADGEQIAYVTTEPDWGYLEVTTSMGYHGYLSLMRPDGTDRRLITTDSTRWYPHFDFSPDGRYIIARSYEGFPVAGRLAVIDVVTGETIPLPYSRGLRLPAWKP